MISRGPQIAVYLQTKFIFGKHLQFLIKNRSNLLHMFCTLGLQRTRRAFGVWVPTFNLCNFFSWKIFFSQKLLSRSENHRFRQILPENFNFLKKIFFLIENAPIHKVGTQTPKARRVRCKPRVQKNPQFWDLEFQGICEHSMQLIPPKISTFEFWVVLLRKICFHQINSSN